MSTDKLLVDLHWSSPTDPLHVPREALPTMYDLPSEDPEESALPDEFHYYQPQLLRETLAPSHYAPDRVFVGTDLNLYYDLRHPLRHKRPDWRRLRCASLPRHLAQRERHQGRVTCTRQD